MIIVSIVIDWVRLDFSLGFGLKQLILLLVGIFILLTGIVRSNLWQFTGKRVWRVISIPLSLAGALGIGIVFAVVLAPRPPRPDQAVLKNLWEKRQLEPTKITILVDKEKKKVINVTSDKAALVLIDTWEDDSGKLDNCYRNIKTLLEQARKHGVTIIHAPSHPVVDRYPQYHALRGEVEAFLQASFFEKLVSRYYFAIKKGHKLAEWPPEVNVSAGKLKPVMHKFSWKTLASMDTPGSDVDIALCFRPQNDEFVLFTEEELRYVLWRRRIQVLLYAGQRTNGCILDRPAGVLNLGGSNYTIVLIGDCSVPFPSPNYSTETVQKVFEEYYRRRGFVTYSKDIIWDKI